MEIKNYLHYYIGCEMQNIHSKTKDVKILTSNNIVQMLVRRRMPLLKHLCDMTEIDRDYFGWDKETFDYTKNELNYKTIYLHADEFEYLLRQRYDLFGLIPNGLAINKTLTP